MKVGKVKPEELGPGYGNAYPLGVLEKWMKNLASDQN